MFCALKTIIGSDIERLFDPMYENVLYKSTALNEDNESRFNRTLLQFSYLPDDFTNLCAALENENTGAKEIAKLIYVNPSLAAKVLKLVNSAHYGLMGKISDLNRAVLILGFKVMRSLLLGTNLFATAKKSMLPKEMTLTDLWKHSVGVSQTAMYIGNELGGVDTAMLISAGLLHDAGKLMLAVYHQTNFQRVVKAVEEDNGDLVEHELGILGVSHPLMSAALAVRWHLPLRLQDVIFFQQHPNLAEDKRAAAVLTLSEYFVRTYNIGNDGQPAREFPPEDALKVLEIPQDQAANMVSKNDMAEIIEHTENLAQAYE
jgi:HD-like signal output (HDOD) protein